MAQTTKDEVQAEKVAVGMNPDTTRTEKTAEQLDKGVSPVTDDASAKAERAVADEPTPAARNRRSADGSEQHSQSVHDRLDALEADVAKLRAQLRHSL